MKDKEPILVTGTGGFIGFHVARRLLEQGEIVHGIDNLCHSYYSPQLKRKRLHLLHQYTSYTHHEIDLSDTRQLTRESALFADIRAVIHLAAQACVLYSFDHPLEYVKDNIVGFQNLLELYRGEKLDNFIYASSSSVYGNRPFNSPVAETAQTDQPVSIYGATKISNETMAQAYYATYRRPMIGLRFFKVYGPWARPDTVFFKFVDSIYHRRPIELRNFGGIHHSFTYIDDVVNGVMAALCHPPPPDFENIPHPRYNLGNPDAVSLKRCVEIIEAELGVKAHCTHTPLPKGDRAYSCADIGRARRDLQFKAQTSIEDGLRHFIHWYKGTYVPECLGPCCS